MNQKSKTRRMLASCIAVLACCALVVGMLAGCGSSTSTSDASSSDDAKPTVKVGSKSFTESLILGQLTMQSLEAAGYPVEDKTNVDGSAACYSALTSGEFDVYYEYLGTLWQGVLQNDTVINDIDELYQADQEAVEGDGVTMLDYGPWNSTYTIGITPELAEEGNITTYSDLVAYMNEHPGELKFGCNEEFTTRTDCYLGLIDTYGMDFGDENVVTMDMGLVFDALDTGQVDVGMLFNDDGRINDYDFVLLEDDKNFFPIYNGVAMVRTDILEESPEIADVLNAVTAQITDEEMRTMCHKVDVENMEPSEVAAEWLEEKGLA